MFEILIWLVPAAVLVAGVWRPRAGLLVLVAAVPLFGVPPGGPYLAALDAAALAAVVTAWRSGPAPRSRMDGAAVAFVVVSLASIVSLSYQPPSWQPSVLIDLLRGFPGVQSFSPLYAWRAAANLILGWALYVAVRRAFAGRSLRPLGIALAVGAVPTLLLGFASRAGLVDLWAYRPIGDPLFDSRMHSLFFHSGWLAEYLVLAIPVAVAALFGGATVRRAGSALLAMLALVAVVLTLQRGAWLAALVQIGCLFLWLRVWPMRPGRWRRTTARAAGLAVLALLLAIIVFPGGVRPVRERLADGLMLSGRSAVWKDSLKMVRERPALGSGLGSFVVTHKKHEQQHPGRGFLWLTAHSQYLMIAAERGLLGLLSFAWLAWSLAGRLRDGLRHEDAQQRRVARGLVVAFVGFAVYGVAQYVFFIKALEWLFWMLLGGAVAVAPQPPRRHGNRIAVGLLTVTALLLVVLQWVANPPAAATGDRAFGFHLPELSNGHEFSWVEGHAARRLVRQGDSLVLELANGHPRAGDRPLEVTVRLNGRMASRLTVRGGWEAHRFPLGPEDGESVVLELEVRPVFRPFSDYLSYPELERSRDIRCLGVAVRPVRWR